MRIEIRDDLSASLSDWEECGEMERELNKTLYIYSAHLMAPCSHCGHEEQRDAVYAIIAESEEEALKIAVEHFPKDL